MARTAWIDPEDNNRLLAHGYTLPGPAKGSTLEVADVFPLDPRDGWRWDGAAWVAFPFPPLPPSELALALDDALADPQPAGPKLKAVLAALRKVTR